MDHKYEYECDTGRLDVQANIEESECEVERISVNMKYECYASGTLYEKNGKTINYKTYTQYLISTHRLF